METKTQVVLDENHVYTVAGVRKPGFSEILEANGFSKNPYWTADGRAEGIALHQWLLFLAQGNEAGSAPDPRIAGRVRGIQKFLREHEFKFKGGETPLYCSEYGYCCTPDLWGYLNGVSVVIEAKRGTPIKRHKLQTAAQVLALNDNGFWPVERFGLYLKDDGYILEAHEDDEDFECWKAILAGYFAKGRYA